MLKNFSIEMVNGREKIKKAIVWEKRTKPKVKVKNTFVNSMLCLSRNVNEIFIDYKEKKKW